MSAAAAAAVVAPVVVEEVIAPGVIEEVVAPVVVQGGSVAAAPATYVINPVSTIGSTTVPVATGSVAYYVSSGGDYSQYADQKVVSLAVGDRVVYQSKTLDQKFPGEVVQRNAAGWLLKLDCDGGVKEVVDAEMWRVEKEGVVEVKTEEKKVKKEKKSKKSKKRGCC